jgi:DedD protein
VEPRTHYQVSFTSKQALSLFVGLLVALALAYFFGLMTGLSGRQPREAAAAPSETPAAAGERAAVAAPETAEHIVFPAPVTAVAVEKPPAAPPAKVQPFEDREGEAPRVRAAARAATRAPATESVAAKPGSAASAGFRVQVVSVSSRAEADAEAARLSRRGFPARVEPGTGPKGTIYRVRVGPFASREDAARTSERLAAEGRRDTWIVPPSQ